MILGGLEAELLDITDLVDRLPRFYSFRVPEHPEGVQEVRMTLRLLPKVKKIILGFEILEIGLDMPEIFYKTPFEARVNMGCRYKPYTAFSDNLRMQF